MFSPWLVDNHDQVIEANQMISSRFDHSGFMILTRVSGDPLKAPYEQRSSLCARGQNTMTVCRARRKRRVKGVARLSASRSCAIKVVWIRKAIFSPGKLSKWRSR